MKYKGDMTPLELAEEVAVALGLAALLWFSFTFMGCTAEPEIVTRVDATANVDADAEISMNNSLLSKTQDGVGNVSVDTGWIIAVAALVCITMVAIWDDVRVRRRSRPEDSYYGAWLGGFKYAERLHGKHKRKG